MDTLLKSPGIDERDVKFKGKTMIITKYHSTKKKILTKYFKVKQKNKN
jgi:hypothetical protein